MELQSFCESTVEGDDQVAFIRNHCFFASKIIFPVLLICLLSLPSKHAYALCDDPAGGGAVFKDFEEIVIFYADFTSASRQQVPDYPKDLKYGNFTKLLTDTVRERFGKCLKTASGGDKPITVFNRLGPGCCTYEKLVEREKMYNPKTLTIIMSVVYWKDHYMTPGIEDYGHLSAILYRPGLSEQQTFMLLQKHTFFATIFPKRGNKALREQLVAFFRQIRPINYPMPNPEQNRMLYNNEGQ
jgi:hypothetical protein